MLRFASPSMTEGQKRRLLSDSPFGRDLFSCDTLDNVIQEFEGRVATTSHLDLSRMLAKSLSGDKKKQGSSSSGSSQVVPPSASAGSISQGKGSSWFPLRGSSSSSPRDRPPRKDTRGGKGKGTSGKSGQTFRK